MNFLFPILAAVLQAGSFTLDKIILSIRRVNFKTYCGVSFPLIFLITLVIFLIFHPPLSFQLLAGNLGWLLAGSAALLIISNLIFYRALDGDQLGEIQIIELLYNIPIIIFSSLIFADERKFFVVIPALIASVAVVWAHWERRHFKLARFTFYYLIFSLITAPMRASIYKLLLAAWNPISLQLVHDGAAAFILGPLFSSQVRKVSFRAFSLLMVTNILTSIAWILFYFSYQRSGIVYTVLIFSLQPLLVYLASAIFLKERHNWKKSFAFAVVLVAIVVAQIIKR